MIIIMSDAIIFEFVWKFNEFENSPVDILSVNTVAGMTTAFS